MADNIDVTPGTGKTVAADDIGGGVLAQRVKVVFGPDGTGNDVDTASGKALPVQLRSPTGVDLTGSAGTASAAVITVQGIASGTAQPVSIATAPALVAGSAVIGKVGIDQTTPGTTDRVTSNIDKVGGTAIDTNSGSKSGGTQRVVIATDQPQLTNALKVDGSATTQPISNSALTKFGAGEYEIVAASQSTQTIGATGASGDYLSHVVVSPTTVSPGVVTIFDNATTIVAFPGGTNSLSNLVPFVIPVGIVSSSGAWKITTGAGVSCVAVGDFT
jgi:hypothetical protein